jgi:cytochrome b561
MTMSLKRVEGYAPIQVGLHWLIAALVLFQLVFGESMVAATDAAEEGTPIDAADAILATAHFWVGLTILLLVAVRLVIRIRNGAPPPAHDNPIVAFAGRATHWLFYILLVAVPVTGLITVYINPEMGEIHQLAKPAFIVLIALHAAAALFHQFVLRDGTLKRMLVPTKPTKVERSA